jgi:hypothetical protein
MLRLEIFEDKIKIFIKKKTEGKIRFKRVNKHGIKEQIKQDEINLMDNNQYIEWQITYNIEASKNDFHPDWLVSECIYRDVKGKKRYPYELSKILLECKKKTWIDNHDYQKLIDEIEKYTLFLEDFQTYIEMKNEKLNLGTLTFEVKKWIIPIYRIYNSDGTFIEAIKEKQQFAYQMQIMVYFCIPFNCYTIDQNPDNPNEIVYLITNDNIDSIINLIKVFGCASKRHQHDILEILRCIQSL